jgi:putative membrane protein
MGLASLSRPLTLEAVAACIAAALASVLVLTGLMRAMDAKTIASPRRLLGLFLVSTLVWIAPLVLGLAVSAVTGLRAGANEFVFGAFLAWGLESIVINGGFVKNALLGLALAAIHPLSVLLIVLWAWGSPYPFPLTTGAVALALMAVLSLRLQRLKTNRGIPALQLLQAFLKTWVVHEPGDLERYFSAYSKKESVVTDVIVLASSGERVALVLPGVHPGPFFPVGSYNVSELIYRALRAEGVAPVVLHGTGGHERNMPTNAMAAAYAGEVSRFVGSQSAREGALMRGPAHDKVGITNVTTLAFGKEVLSIISNAPFLSDDLDPSTVADATTAASNLGLKLALVDAHNSVDGESRPMAHIAGDDWGSILSRVMALPERSFRLGFASSTEMGLKLGSDVSEGGICLTLFITDDGGKDALVSADANNAVSGLRERIAEELGRSGVRLVELCTSDTHNFAARGLTDRGYLALGEGSEGADAVVDAARRLATEAEQETAPCTLAAARLETEAPLIGSGSLDDFAALTKSAVSLSRAYAKLLIPAVLLLAAITLF